MKISTRLDTIQFRTESTLTKDNVPVNVDSVLYMKPVDLEKAVLQVENYLQATQLASQTTLREVIGKVSLNELLAEREKVGARLREIIDEKTEAWGIKVTSVEVRDVIIPSNLQDAMSRQAQAERERMARVTLATAEFEASAKMIEAAKAYESSPEGLRLRWMNILYELGQQSQTNTIMLIPAVYAGSRLASNWNLRLQRPNYGTTRIKQRKNQCQNKNPYHPHHPNNHLNKQKFLFFLFFLEIAKNQLVPFK